MTFFILGDSFNIVSRYLMFFYEGNRSRYCRYLFLLAVLYTELLTLIALVEVSIFGSIEQKMMNVVVSFVQQLVSIKRPKQEVKLSAKTFGCT